jgi:Zn-dependent protease
VKKIIEFFQRQLLITHYYGVPVRVDYRWLIVFILLTYLTAENISKLAVEDFLVRLGLGFTTSIIVFITILLHELAHTRTAIKEGLQVLEIFIHPFGGLAKLRRLPDNPHAEFRIALAGPLVNFFISLIFFGLTFMFESASIIGLMQVCFMIAFFNLLLALFNLFPGYPLDGGRVLRAFLWKRGYELSEATILTGRCGQIIAFALILYGLYLALARRDYFSGVLLIVVGIFLFDSANKIIKEVSDYEKTLVEEVMSVPIQVSPDSTITYFTERILPMYRQTIFLVAKERQFYGLISLDDFKDLPREEWNKTLIEDVMRPVEPNHFVETDTFLDEAREQMRSNGIGAVGVLDKKGNLVGFLQRGRIRKRL